MNFHYPKVTLIYPFEKAVLSSKFRGEHALRRYMTIIVGKFGNINIMANGDNIPLIIDACSKPHMPYTMEGIAANNSMAVPSGRLSQAGASSVKNKAMPKLTGTAISKAIKDVINVP